MMFPLIESFTGKPIDKEYVETRPGASACTKSRR
jgi:hypothetical protein